MNCHCSSTAGEPGESPTVHASLFTSCFTTFVMARLNNILKFLLMNVNVIFATIGLAFFAFSLYLFAGNFGELDPEFFLGVGLILCFVGLSIMFGSCLGCQGAANQNERLGKTELHPLQRKMICSVTHPS